VLDLQRQLETISYAEGDIAISFTLVKCQKKLSSLANKKAVDSPFHRFLSHADTTSRWPRYLLTYISEMYYCEAICRSHR